jgi:regulator of sigma E protease
MTGAIAVILVLGGLIFFHELGHFVFARLFGVGVKVFALGFGPRIAGVKRGKTDYRLAAVPLGGYVAMVGEGPGEELPEGFTREESFATKPAWQRMIIVAAGPISNFLLAFLIFWLLLTVWGRTELAPVIGGVQEDSPAAEAGIEPGDRIVSIDGEEVVFWKDMSEIISASDGETLNVTVKRDGEMETVMVTPEKRTWTNIFGEEKKRFMFGVVAAQETVSVEMDAGSAFVGAFQQTWEVVVLTVQGVKKMIEQVIPLDQLGGPIMIAQIVSEGAKQGVAAVLALAALISVNLGLLNLLPIPVLDGGHILFFAIESITGRPVSERVQGWTIRIGLALLLALMGFAIYNDIQRIISAPNGG